MQGHLLCTPDSTQDAITVDFKYPFTHYSYVNRTSEAGSMSGTASLPYSKVGSASQLFVAWGVLSMFYCIAALAVYIIFTANERWENVVDILVYTVSS